MTMYDDAMRTIIAVPNQQLDAIDALCRRVGISRAEAIRRAVGAYVLQHRVAEPDQAFGLWRTRPQDGLTYEQGLRREWDAPLSARGRTAKKRR
jgi:hypothetical protein